MRVLFSRSCGDPQISSSWCQPSRRLPWQRAGVVAYGRRPKNPDLQLQEPGSSSSPAGLTGSGSTAGGETLRLEGLSAAQSNRSEFPSPSTAPVSALEQDPFKQQRSAAAAAAQPGTAAPRRRRGRPRRQDNAAVTGQGSLPSSNRGVSVIESMDQATLSDILSDAEEDEQYEAAGEEEDTDGGSDAELERLPAGAAALGSSDEEGGTGTADSEEPPGPTEIVFKLERRGDGWGEEIFPHITMEKRPLIKSKHKCQHPDPWEDGSLEYYLIEVGVPPEDVDRVVEQAVAWRFTPGGRALIDRRRRSRVERNVRLVVQHLEMEGGIPFGPKGMGAILARVPEIMLCKPTTNDRWDRRAVELVAFQHTHGHCNVPEEWAQNPELGAWVKRQRLARAAGQLSDDRLAILQGLGFEFGEVAQLTDEWEHRFDQLIDWMLWHKENQQRFSWLGVDWGQRGGITARELALWVSLQGEFRRRNLLPAEAIKRFEAIGVDWEAQDGTPAEREWMAQFSRLLYVIERHNTVTRPYLLQTARLGRPKAGSASVQGMPGSHAGAAGVGLEEEEDAGDEETYRKSTSAILRGRAKLQQELAARRRALAVADLRCEPGLRFWLERQRWLWRQGRLPSEQVLMLQLAGVDMERYTSAQWQEEAHLAAALLQRSEITLSPPPHTPAAAAAEGPRAAAGGMGSAAVQQQARQQQQQVPGPGQRWGGSSVAQQGHQHSAAQPAASGWSRGQQVPHQQQWRSGQQAAQVSGPLAAATYGGRPGSSLDSIAERNGNSSGSSSSQQALSADFGQAVAFASSNSSSGCGSALAAAAGASGSVGGGGILRLRVRRWVQTQAALFHEGHLSPAQLRYLAFLGITWVVSDEVMHMGDASWRARFEQLLALCKQAAADGIPPAAAAAIVADRDLREWLRHQRGLHALGMLREDRRRLLGALGVGWGHPRGEAERAWDARLSELLAFKAEHGHLQVPLKYGPYPPLGPWVEAQRRLLGLEGALDPGCAAQLAAIGLQPSPSTAP